jgi:hypothetical protein
MTEKKPSPFAALYRTEDTWAIWIGFLVIALALAFFHAGSSLKSVAVTPGAWSSPGEILLDLRAAGRT